MSLIKKFTTKNVGNLDRLLRLAPAAMVVYVWQTQSLTGIAFWSLAIIAAMLAFTSLTARCSIYAVLGLSSCKIKS